MFTCPACGEFVEYLTNYHCTTKHNMTRKQLIKKYGNHRYASDMRTREINAWLNKTCHIIRESEYVYAQAAVKSVQK